MTFRTFTLDVVEHIEDVRDRLNEIEDKLADIEEDVEQEMLAEGVDDPAELDSWSAYVEQFNSLEAERTEKGGEVRKLMDAVVHWKTGVDVTTNPAREVVKEEYESVESCVFRVQELSYGQLQAVQDDMIERSFDVDVQREDMTGTPKQGYMEKEIVREALIDWPDSAPTTRGGEPNPGAYPDALAEWLFEKIDAYNTTQESEMGNSSLRDRID